MTLKKTEIFFSRISPLLKGKGAALSQKKKNFFFFDKKKDSQDFCSFSQNCSFFCAYWHKKNSFFSEKKKEKKRSFFRNFKISLFFCFFFLLKWKDGRMVIAPIWKVGSLWECWFDSYSFRKNGKVFSSRRKKKKEKNQKQERTKKTKKNLFFLFHRKTVPCVFYF